jgi:RNA polymerase sigma-70 factor, ECF subfamily
MTDQELIQAFQKGDNQALASLLERHKGVLFGYLMRMTHHRADAEDLFQECCLRLLKVLPKWESRKPFRNLLFTLAGNLCIDRSRRKKVQFKHVQEESADRPLSDTAVGGKEWMPDHILESTQSQAMLEEAVRRLPETSRHLVTLRLQTGMTFQEIADLRQEPLGTILPRMHRAMKSMRRTFEELGYERS